jgi:hypothetical protein
VAVHGVTIGHSAWDGVRPALEPVATLIAVGRRGHGASLGSAFALSRRRYLPASCLLEVRR